MIGFWPRVGWLKPWFELLKKSCFLRFNCFFGGVLNNLNVLFSTDKLCENMLLILDLLLSLPHIAHKIPLLLSNFSIHPLHLPTLLPSLTYTRVKGNHHHLCCITKSAKHSWVNLQYSVGGKNTKTVIAYSDWQWYCNHGIHWCTSIDNCLGLFERIFFFKQLFTKCFLHFINFTHIFGKILLLNIA